MSKQINFLGWDKPATEAVARFILDDVHPRAVPKAAQALAPLVHLDSVLIITPTRESGRSLREKLALLCREKKAALLGARLVTPSFFIQSRENAGQEAGETIVSSAWIRTLFGLRKDDCRTLFPRGIPQNNHQWAFATAKMIHQLRDELSDGGLSINSVLEKYAADLQEPQRWQELAGMEKSYLENLRQTGRLDPCELKLANARAPALPDGIKRIIIASVPDPSLLALAALDGLSKEAEIEILVMAPAELKDHFDEWGRPLPDKWLKRFIDIPAPEKNILVAGNPASQAQSVADLIREGEYHLADICIGVPDRAVIPYLQDKLESAGITSFDPADRPAKDHHLYHLIRSWCKLTENPSFADAAAFLRGADILTYLQDTHGISASELLAELDRLQNRVLPQTMRDAESAVKKSGDFPSLKTTIKFVNEIIVSTNTRPAHEALRFFLEQIFASKTITNDSGDGADFRAVAAHISGILNDITYALDYTKDFPAQFINQLIISRLDALSIPRHREGAQIDLNGWLELAWNEAPFMIITGFNEGQVPDSRKSDIFLPDSLRKKLGLRNNETRFARDAYLLSSILAARGRQGRVTLIAGKTSPEGDPLKPSRLLFRCPDGQLAERAGLIFKEVREEIHNPPFSISFKLDPAAPLLNCKEPILPAELHATQFRDYLACPFRFYLKHVLKMERTEFKAELDALDFGTAIHAVLEKFSGNPEINGSADSGVIQKHLHGMLDEHFKAVYGKNDSFPVLYAREIAGQRLKAFAVHQAQIAAGGWEIVEHEFSCQLKIGGVKVAGKIDRVDRNRHDGRMRIIDYKTSDSAENPKDAHLKKSRREIPDYARLQDVGREQWIDLQMPLYWQMLRNTGLTKEHKEIELCYFNLPGTASGAGIEAWENFDESLAESACKSAEKITGRIKQGIFWPPSDSVKYDDYESLFHKDMRAYFEGEKITESFAAKMHKETQRPK